MNDEHNWFWTGMKVQLLKEIKKYWIRLQLKEARIYELPDSLLSDILHRPLLISTLYYNFLCSELQLQ